MNCETAKEHMADYLANELEDTLCTELREHLESCDACTRELDRMNELFSLMELTFQREGTPRELPESKLDLIRIAAKAPEGTPKKPEAAQEKPHAEGTAKPVRLTPVQAAKTPQSGKTPQKPKKTPQNMKFGKQKLPTYDELAKEAGIGKSPFSKVWVKIAAMLVICGIIGFLLIPGSATRSGQSRVPVKMAAETNAQEELAKPERLMKNSTLGNDSAVLPDTDSLDAEQISVSLSVSPTGTAENHPVEKDEKRRSMPMAAKKVAGSEKMKESKAFAASAPAVEEMQEDALPAPDPLDAPEEIDLGGFMDTGNSRFSLRYELVKSPFETGVYYLVCGTVSRPELKQFAMIGLPKFLSVSGTTLKTRSVEVLRMKLTPEQFAKPVLAELYIRIDSKRKLPPIRIGAAALQQEGIRSIPAPFLYALVAGEAKRIAGEKSSRNKSVAAALLRHAAKSDTLKEKEAALKMADELLRK